MSQYTVTATSLNLRQQPSTSSEIVRVAKQKEVLEVIDFSLDKWWAKVRIDGRNIVWAASAYLEPIQQGNSLLFSLNDFTQKAHRDEQTIEQYFVTLIHDPAGNVSQVFPDGSPEMSLITGGHQLKQWYLLGITPIFYVERNKKHTFPGGLPLFHKKDLTDYASVYLAVMESDHTSRVQVEKLMGSLKKLFIEPETDPLMKAVLDLIGVANPTAELLGKGFGLAIKAIEAVLINNGDDIDYTNVFTFKQSNDFLRGRHSDWGNQRVDLTFDVEIL